VVVLSACETSLEVKNWGGVFGLHRAFAQAGARSIVMSLWNASDVSTALLMRRFYESFIAGQLEPAALRGAEA